MLAIDWSGDAGLDRAGGASAFLTLAIVACDEPVVTAVLTQLRETLRLPRDYEFHFAHELDRTRAAFAAAIPRAILAATVVVVDKPAVRQQRPGLLGNELLATVIATALPALPRATVERATVIIDGGKDAKKLCARVRQELSLVMADQGLPYRVGKVRPHHSPRHDGLMVADMLGGAAYHHARRRHPD